MLGRQGIRRLGGLACAGLVAVACPARADDVPPPLPDPATTAPVAPISAVDRTYRGSNATLTITGDQVTVNAYSATGALGWRLRTARDVRVTAACSADVVALDLDAPFDGTSARYEQIVTPDVAHASASITVPGLADRVRTGVDGCRATVTEPAGYRVQDVAVGFTRAARKALYTQSLRTDDRNRQSLAAGEAAITSALTHYVSHDDDLRGWGPTPDGRVPDEATLRLRVVSSLRAVALRPAYDDVVYLVLPADGVRSRDRLTIVAASTAIDRRLLVIGRDLRTGRVRYQVVDRAGLRVRYDRARPPYAECSNPVQTSRCTDGQPPHR